MKTIENQSFINTLFPLSKNKTLCATGIFFIFTCLAFVMFWLGAVESSATMLHFFREGFGSYQNIHEFNLNSVFVNLIYPTEINKNHILIPSIFDNLRNIPMDYKIYLSYNLDTYILVDNEFYEVRPTINFWTWAILLFLQNPIFYFVMNRLLNTQEINIRTEHLINEKIDKDYLADKVAQTMGSYIHHELKTPLTAIEAISTKNKFLIDELEIDPKIKEELNKNYNLLENSVMNMFNTINAVQQLKTLDDNKNISIYDVIERSLEIFKLSSSYKFTYLVDKEFKQCKPDKLNPHLLSNIIINHVKNSLEADARIIKFEYNDFYTQNDKTILQMYIIDDGKGIPKEVLKTAYDLKVTTKKNGTGVGLYICKEVLNQFGGDENIQMTSEYGTVIDLKIPVLECKRFKNDEDKYKNA